MRERAVMRREQWKKRTAIERRTAMGERTAMRRDKLWGENSHGEIMLWGEKSHRWREQRWGR